MSAKDEIQEWIEKQPGKRGKDIPAPIYDRIFHAAHAITRPVWGRVPTPQQMQWLYQNGHHTPDQIHSAFESLPHPHVPNSTVGDYKDWKRAYQTYKEHTAKR